MDTLSFTDTTDVLLPDVGNASEVLPPVPDSALQPSMSLAGREGMPGKEELAVPDSVRAIELQLAHTASESAETLLVSQPQSVLQAESSGDPCQVSSEQVHQEEPSLGQFSSSCKSLYIENCVNENMRIETVSKPNFSTDSQNLISLNVPDKESQVDNFCITDFRNCENSRDGIAKIQRNIGINKFNNMIGPIEGGGGQNMHRLNVLAPVQLSGTVQNIKSLSSYASVAALHPGARPPPVLGIEPECGVLIEKVRGFSTDDYARAVIACTGVGSVVFLGASPKDQSYMLAFLKTPSLASKVVQAGVKVRNRWLCVSYFQKPAIKVTASGVLPFVSDKEIFQALAPFAKPVFESTKRIPASTRSPELGGILSYRRELHLYLHDGAELPEKISVSSHQMMFEIELSTYGMRCYRCKQPGHLIARCKMKVLPLTESVVNDGLVPVVKVRNQAGERDIGPKETGCINGVTLGMSSGAKKDTVVTDSRILPSSLELRNDSSRSKVKVVVAQDGNKPNGSDVRDISNLKKKNEDNYIEACSSRTTAVGVSPIAKGKSEEEEKVRSDMEVQEEEQFTDVEKKKKKKKRKLTPDVVKEGDSSSGLLKSSKEKAERWLKTEVVISGSSDRVLSGVVSKTTKAATLKGVGAPEDYSKIVELVLEETKGRRSSNRLLSVQRCLDLYPKLDIFLKKVQGNIPVSERSLTTNKRINNLLNDIKTVRKGAVKV